MVDDFVLRRKSSSVRAIKAKTLDCKRNACTISTAAHGHHVLAYGACHSPSLVAVTKLQDVVNQIIAILVGCNIDEWQTRTSTVIRRNRGNSFEIARNHAWGVGLDSFLEHFRCELVRRVVDNFGKYCTKDAFAISFRTMFNNLWSV